MAILKQGSTTLNAGAKGDKGDTGTGSGGVGVVVSILSDFDSVVANDIVSIQGDIDLASASLTIPDGVTLRFEGGSIKNGTINFGVNNTIIAEPYEIFGYGNTFTGKAIRPQGDYPEWFGVKVGVANKVNNFFAYAGWTAFAEVQGGGILTHTNTSDDYCLPDRNPVDNGTHFENGGWEWDKDFWEQCIVYIPSNTTFTSVTGAKIRVDGSMLYNEGDLGFGYWRLLGTNPSSENVHIFNNHFIGTRALAGNSDQQHLFVTNGSNNYIIVEQNIIEQFGGDGWMAKINNSYLGANTLRTFELGKINTTTGAFEASSTSVRTTALTPYDIAGFPDYFNEYYMLVGSINGAYMGVKGGLFDLFIYNSSNALISIKKNLSMYEKINLVEGADYAHIVLNQTNLQEEWGSRKGIDINPALTAWKFTDNSKFINNKVYEMGRQVVSVTGFQNLEISGNYAEQITGSPGAFVDFEDARQLNRNISIHNNHIKDYNRGIMLFNAKNVNIHDNYFHRGSGEGIKGIYSAAHVTVPEESENINIYNNFFNNGSIQISQYCTLYSNEFLLTSVQVACGTAHDNKYVNSTLTIDDGVLTGGVDYIKDEKADALVYNERFIYDIETMQNQELMPDGITVSGTIARTNVVFRDIYIDGNCKNATLKFYNPDAIVKNIIHHNRGLATTQGRVRFYYGGGNIDGFIGENLEQWGGTGDTVIKNSEFSLMHRAVTGGTITIIDPIKPFTFTGQESVDKVLFTKANPNLEVFADNASAIAGGIPTGYMYRTATGETRMVYTP